jgi:Terminase small subunit
MRADEADKSKRKLTIKQTRFAASYADPRGANGNGTLAAKIAGYRGKGTQLAVQASANLRNPKIRQSIAETLDANGCTVERAALAVAEAMEASKQRSFLAKSGKIVYAATEPDHKVRLHAAQITLRLHDPSGRQNEGARAASAGQRAATNEADDPVVPVTDPDIERELAAIPQAERVVVRSVLDKIVRLISLSDQGAERSATLAEPPAGNAESGDQ